ncbi:MAG TPA: oligosaccharide flippase family protein [Nitrospira sp.]|nr:oligosaccharide flippase family protein [Nitrospira sp.]
MIEELAQLGKHSLAYGLGNGFTKLVSFLALPFLTRELIPEEYAIITVLAVFGVVYRSLFSLGLGASTGLVYFQESDSAKRPAVIGAGVFIQGLIIVVLLLISIRYSGVISQLVLRDADFGPLVMLYTLSASLQLLAQPILLDLQFRQQASRFILLTSLTALVSMAAILVLVIGAGHGVSGWVEGDLLGSILLFVGAVIIDRRHLSFRFHRTHTGELLRLGLPLVPSAIFLFIIQCSGTYLLQWYVNREDVGIYGLGYSMGMALGLATSGFSSAWFPFFQSYIGKERDAQTVFPTVLLWYTIIFGSLCYLFVVLGKPVILLLIDTRYIDSFRIVSFTAIGQFCIGLWSVLLPGMYFAKETHYVSVIQGITAVLVILLNFSLIPILGIEGAGLALCLGTIILVILQHVCNVVRRYAVSIGLWSRAQALVTVLVAMATMQVAVNAYLPLAVSLLVGLMVCSGYLTLSWWVLSTNEKSTIAGWTPLWLRTQQLH